MLTIVIKYWVEFAFGIIAAGLIAGYKRLMDKQKKASAEQKAIADGVKALLRDRIIQSCNHHADKGYFPLYARENVEDLFKVYKALGGNGTVEYLVNETEKLPREKNS